MDFARSERSTVGLEWELALVDADTGNLRQVAPVVIDALTGGGRRPHIAPEFLRNTIEVVSGVHRTVPDAVVDLQQAIGEIRTVTDAMRVELMSAGTHPFAQWAEQKVTDKERYTTVLDRTQVWGRQLLIYGVHVHVGIEDRAKVLPIVNAMLAYLPHLQALSASSPYFNGVDTGYASMRALLFQQIPAAGVPYQFETWKHLESYVHDMTKTGVIEDFNEVRWDVRPAPRFGTIEVRVCDGTPNVAELASLGALTHCLVERMSTALDEGRTLPTMPPWFVHENKWRAARYGLDAIIILDADGNEALVTDAIGKLLVELEPVADRLGCRTELDGVRDIMRHGASYQRQRAVAAAHAGEAEAGLEAVVASLVAELRAGHPLASR